MLTLFIIRLITGFSNLTWNLLDATPALKYSER